MSAQVCSFCPPDPARVTADTGRVVLLRSLYPVSPGHTLVILKRHVATFFDATWEERAYVLEALDLAKMRLDQEFAPAGYNVGFNAGRAAGQTVMHVHLHVIPRFEGDVADPRGGIRHCIPGKGFPGGTP